MKFIFNIDNINKSVMEIGYDPKKMPLGSLTESTIKEGFEILNKIDAAIKNKENSILSELSDEFY